jgi:hypothetical protein
MYSTVRTGEEFSSKEGRPLPDFGVFDPDILLRGDPEVNGIGGIVSNESYADGGA